MRLGEMLLGRQLVSAEDLDRALELQKERGEKIGKILVDGGYCAARDVMATLAEQLNVPLMAIDGPPAFRRKPKSCRRDSCGNSAVCRLPLQDSSMTLAMSDPLDFETLAAVRTFTGLRIDPVLASEQEILDAIDQYYGETDRIDMPSSTATVRRRRISSICAIWPAKRLSYGW